MTIKDAVLETLKLNKGTFCSGEELSNKLGVSRTAVWKAINTLREEGYPIEAVTNKGYLFMEDAWQITENSLKANLPKEYRNINIEIHDSLDSTNIRAKQAALENAPHGTVIISRQQTGGRGRLGRSFFSPREGIYLSILVKPNFDMSKSILITSAAAVAVAEAIESVSGQSAEIKWVNDVYVNGKKVCGILTEGIASFETGQIEYMVIGIGINTTVKDFPEELKEIVGAVEGTYSKSALAAEVISRTLKFAETIDPCSFMPAYKEKSMVIGKNVTVYKGRYKINPEDEISGVSAHVLDIDDDGGLIVCYSDGTQEKLISGEISIRL